MMGQQILGCLVVAGLLLGFIGCGEGRKPSSVSLEPRQTVVPTTATPSGIVNHTVQSLTGETVDLTSFRGRPMLIVNTASKCGYTPQYAGLQELYERYGEGDLVVIGFPSNDFGNQEPGTAEEIGNFCRLNYGVTFPMMAKVHTKGPNQAPVYTTLTSESAEDFQGEIRWNFTKFLIDQDGRVVERFESGVDPLDDQVISAIDALLGDGNQQG
jgi:glutathione peroxidase